MKNDAVFTEALAKSRTVATNICRWLCDKGYSVVELEQRDRTCREDRWDYVDDGDLLIRQRIEVKQRPELDFQGADDLPYPDIIVDEVYKLDKVHKYGLHSYIIVNASETCCMVILAESRKHWFKRTVFDSKEKEDREFYFIPKQMVRFVKIT
jgi:hypothetical protein